VREISAKTHHHRVDFNVFEGMKVHGIAETTIVRGQIVWDGTNLHVTKGK